jgi:hypothetical protein
LRVDTLTLIEHACKAKEESMKRKFTAPRLASESTLAQLTLTETVSRTGDDGGEL